MLLNMLMYKLNKSPLVGMGYGWAFAAMSFAVRINHTFEKNEQTNHD